MARYNPNEKFINWDKMSLFEYYSVRKYQKLPPTFLHQLHDHFGSQKMQIKKFNAGRSEGVLKGVPHGTHLNFKPVVLVHTMNYADGYEVAISYYAKVRGRGIVTGILTCGITWLSLIGTIPHFLSDAGIVIDNIWWNIDQMANSKYEVVASGTIEASATGEPIHKDKQKRENSQAGGCAPISSKHGAGCMCPTCINHGLGCQCPLCMVPKEKPRHGDGCLCPTCVAEKPKHVIGCQCLECINARNGVAL
jgi:hypothetical protein